MSFEPNASPTVMAFDNSITGRISQLRQMHADLRSRPVTGSLTALRKPFYKIVRSAFSRQHALNEATVELIERMYGELERREAPQPTTAIPVVSTDANLATLHNVVPGDTAEVLASCGQSQDQAKINNIRPLHGFNAVYSAPAELRMPERVALYSLVFGLQPRKCLEIGTFRGGSSAIICGALDDTGFGELACVDPSPRVAPDLWARLSHRCRMFEGPSPDVLQQVADQTGGQFDFAFIDGNHTYDCLRADIAGVLPLMADQAYLLFHDANYDDVKRAIDEAVAIFPTLTDCGKLSVEPTLFQDNGQTVTWAGMRLLRYEQSHRR